MTPAPLCFETLENDHNVLLDFDFLVLCFDLAI